MNVPGAIEAVAVVVPARDEEGLLGRSLAAIERAAARLGDRVAVRIVVALDGCTDASAAIVARHPVTALELPAVGVGRARAAGVRRALAEFAGLAGLAPERIWIANTDADSVVPPDWLSMQLAYADAGADVVLGTVTPDHNDLPLPLHGVPLTRDLADGAVYGANLGVRARSYLAAGGFPPARENEDVRLVERLRADGARILPAAELAVLTSGRSSGRSPGGFAGYLRAALGRLEPTG